MWQLNQKGHAVRCVCTYHLSALPWGSWWSNCPKRTLSEKKRIHHFHIDHNAPCSPPKFCITITFNFSWDETGNNGYAISFGEGKEGINKVHYGLCERVNQNSLRASSLLTIFAWLGSLDLSKPKWLFCLYCLVIIIHCTRYLTSH